MSVSIKSLNGDTTFLLTFQPSATAGSSLDSFTILIDPWLTGAAHVLSPKFALIKQKEKPCLSSIAQLPVEPDLVLISQDKPDHCHKETLCQLSSDSRSVILAAPSATKRIQKWGHFDPTRVVPMQRYTDSSSIFRKTVHASSPSSVPGEITVSYIASKWDVKGLHNAIGISYRPPKLDFPNATITLPPTPPDSPMSPRSISTKFKEPILPLAENGSGRTISVIYTPHGISYNTIRPYASQHLNSENALPLSALIHSLDRVENPWYLGGNIATGFPGGRSLVRNLSCTTWIAAHDADKEKTGISVQLVRTLKYPPEQALNALKEAEGDTISTCIVSLGAGQEYEVGATTRSKEPWILRPNMSDIA